MSIHNGHRQRLRERFMQEGLDNFNDLHALELLLFYCMPRVDTNPLAHRLLDKFGSFDGVLDANPRELTEIPGVGENVAAFISLLKSAWRYYEVKRRKQEKALTTVAMCGAYIKPYFINRDVETVYLLCLDAKCKVLCCKMIGEGSVNSANISVRKIVETAINANATTVILAHNHPSGVALPSGEDVQTTQRLAQALKAVEIILADHLVFADGEFVSIAQSGAYTIPSNLDFGALL